MHTFDTHNIFPEYFLISIPLFDDVIKQEIDEWLYLMKHSDVRKDFKSPYMEKVAERLSILKMTNTEREIYDTYIMDSMKGRDYLISAESKGEARGKAEGREEGKAERDIEIAKAMLLDGDPIEKITRITKLSIEEIKKLTIFLKN